MQTLDAFTGYEILGLTHSGKEGHCTDLVLQKTMAESKSPGVVQSANHRTMLWEEKSPT